MDVTFTNVLEGARQYFQGLPAATGSSASPAYPIGDQSRNTNQTSNRTSYWPPQQESQIRTAIREKPGSTSVDVSRPPSHHAHHHAETIHRSIQHADTYKSTQNNGEVQRVPPYHTELHKPTTELHRANSNHGEIQRSSSFNGEISRQPSHNFEIQRQQPHQSERSSHHTDMQRTYQEMQIPTSHQTDLQRPSPHQAEMQRSSSQHAEMQRPLSHHGETQRPPSHQGDMQRPPSHHGEMQRPPSHQGEIQRPPSHHGEMQRPPSHHGEMQRPPSHHGEMQRPPSHHSDIQRPSSLHNEMQRPTSHQGEMQRPLSYHGEAQRPPSHHGEGQRIPSQVAEVQRSSSQHSEMQRTSIQNQYPEQSRTANYSYAETSNAQFQFTRPHSREASSHVQQQYSAHILPNPTYHHVQQQYPQQQHIRKEQLTNSGSQSYHQLQPPQNTSQSNSQPVANYSTPSRTYYQMTTVTKPQGTASNYKLVSSSYAYTHLADNAYNNNNNSSYTSNTQPSSVNNYVNQKSALPESKSHTSHNENVSYSQPHRTTHNLPPIAALSSVNYHSNRSNRGITNNQRGRQVVTVASNNNSVAHQYVTQQNHHQEQISEVQPMHSIKNNYYPSSITITTTTTTYTQPIPSSGSMNTMPQTSSNVTGYHNVQKTTSQQQQQPLQNNQLRNTSFPVKLKRESPLDLSVKTVRTSADSTLDDTDELQKINYTNNNNNTRLTSMQQQQQQQQTHYVPQHSTSSAVQPSVSYPTYDMSANTIQRNLSASRSHLTPSVGAPKVDFNPNFNVPSLKQTPQQQQQQQQQQAKYFNNTRRNQQQFNYDKNYNTPAMPYGSNQQQSNLQQRYVTSNNVVVQNNSNYVAQVKRPIEGLPRIDFPPPEHGHKSPAMFPVNPNEINKKRPAIVDPGPSMIPTKVPKIDNWKQTIDQQIEQRLSSYVKSKMQQQQQQHQQQNDQKVTINNKPPLINGNYQQEKTLSTYHRQHQYQSYPTSNQYPSNHHHIQTNHNQTYVPSAVPHQYPDYNNAYNTQQSYNHQQPQWNNNNNNSQQQMISTLSPVKQNVGGGGADKRVLSLLRNSLEIKGAKEAQRKLEQKEQLIQNVRTDIQQPSTDVTAPLQPKIGLVGRHNVSPFTASSLLERNSNTPPSPYKFHFPKAMDSVKIESEINKNSIMRSEKPVQGNNMAINHNNNNNNTPGDLDGLAAFLAARIRTKAELKQVGSSQNIPSNNSVHNNSSLNLTEDRLDYQQSAQISNGPSKYPSKDRCSSMYSPRKKLFCRMEEENAVTASVIKTASLPPREKSGMRSSSETSVFDFPDSDSEIEMPVLERQSLEDMRRDRKLKPLPLNDNEIKTEQSLTSSRQPSPFDDIFNDACDNFMEQLKKGIGKKRGRRKKDTILDSDDIKVESEVKNDGEIIVETTLVNTDNIQIENIDVKKEVEDSDSDVPLSKCKKEIEQTELETVEEIKKEVEDESVDNNIVPECESKDVETKKEPEEKINTEKTTVLTLPVNLWPKPAKKPTFGDGSDFYPGWEEALYRYKRSLRMPSSLIHVTRPPNCQRLSSSLPDLDPCPISPAPSSIPDSSTEYNSKLKTKNRNETVDSDVESNCSFNFSFNKTNYDSEGSSSVKSLKVAQVKQKEHSILDKLLERYGPKKRKKYKKKDEANGPKIIPKAESEVELLPTPSLEVKSESKQIIRGDSVLLGFRKKTVENFKGAFIKNNNSVVGVTDKFATVVLNSRTRKQTRVLKQKATIREVFGEDRPASAPPVTCIDDLKQRETESEEPSIQLAIETKTKRKDSRIDINTKEVLKSKLINKGKKQNDLLKDLTTKKIKIELPDDNKDVDNKSETTSIIDDADDSVLHNKKKVKLRNIRRKFSSGFDYIRKKKKQIKKETVESENVTPKQKRRSIMPKATPESVQDIQKEIKTWVLNKGIGETHLHRAARLGYTDVTAYCLEKMNCPASPKDNAGYTPLHEACSRGHLSIARLLLMYGANVSESAQGGIRPLHEAAENGYVEIVRLLLSYGADPALATYSGLTPLSLAVDEATASLLQNHLAEIQGQPTVAWQFLGPISSFDVEETGYDPLEDVPKADPIVENEDLDFEVTDVLMPNLYALSGENPNDRWVLLQDLSNILKIKSRDTLLKQLGSISSSSSSCTTSVTSSSSSATSNNIVNNNKNIIKEMKMNDFLEQAQCCQFLNAGEKINIRASKIALVKYTDKVRQLLNVEKVVITSR